MWDFQCAGSRCIYSKCQNKNFVGNDNLSNAKNCNLECSCSLPLIFSKVHMDNWPY